MGAIGVSAFIFRDFVQYILPTIIGAALFAPLFSPSQYTPKPEAVLFFAIILAYIVGAPIEAIASKVHARTPFRSLNFVGIRQRHLWWSQNWNYDDLWVMLNKDEQEYLSLVYSFFRFYQVNAFYFLIYAAANLLLVLKHVFIQANTASTASVVPQAPPSSLLVAGIPTIQTPMLGDWSMPSLYLVLLSLLFMGVCYWQAVKHYTEAFGDEGLLVSFATKYHREKGAVALRVWGAVYQEEKATDDKKNNAPRPVANVTVQLSLCKPRRWGGTYHEYLGRAVTDIHGYFCLQKVYDKCLQHTCCATVKSEEWQGKCEITVSENTIPSFIIYVNKIDPQSACK